VRRAVLDRVQEMIEGGMKRLVSVVTINFNDRAGLERTIESVEDQKRKGAELEFIVIDGGSTDGSLAVLEDRKAVVDVLVSERDRGIYDAMNKGLARASGESILFLNAGDRFFSLFDLRVFQEKYPLETSNVWCGTIQTFHGDAYVRSPVSRPDLGVGAVGHAGIFVPRCAYSRCDYDLAYSISADSIWKSRVSELAPVIRASEICAIFELGGVSNSPSMRQVSRLLRQPGGYGAAGKGLLKLLLYRVVGARRLYRWLYRSRYDRVPTVLIDSLEDPGAAYSRLPGAAPDRLSRSTGPA
jgi:glycosyltransferase involved in cell wall biosynthesis